ncbi:Highly reducing polyketide synthase gloL [Cladobotryum mycophilum]|uniref:Highly reducing polyketide synthase gloL n=1 Tax=Cladobotryum mycophilum TaxID=491253 RepID=A0ABR0SPV1_9HYPO
MDHVWQDLAERPSWKIEDMLRSDDARDSLDGAELAQPLCVAIQVGLINLLAKCNITPDAVVGHSSGEIAAAYAAAAMTMIEAIICGYLRGQVDCEISSRNITLSGNPIALKRALDAIQDDNEAALVQRLRVNLAYHSDHMREIASNYEEMLASHLSHRVAAIPFYSTVTGRRLVSKAGAELDPGSPT